MYKSKSKSSEIFNFKGMTPYLSKIERIILELLYQLDSSKKNELYGLEMVEKSDGLLKRGTVYVVLNRMNKKGYVSSRKEDQNYKDQGTRRLYSITTKGQKIFEICEEARANAMLNPT